MQAPTFDRTGNSFFNTIREKVDHYFSENRIDPAGNRKLYIKGSLLVLSAVLFYSILVFGTPGIWISLLLCVLLGLNLGAIGFNIMHEGGHQSFSKHAFLNSVAAYFLNVLGGNTYFWKIKHNVNHHTYTNIEGIDSDIDIGPFMRLHKDQPLYSLHKFQHVYWFFLYGISYVVWIYYEDFVKYFQGKAVSHMAAKSLSFKEHVIFWVTKLLYTFFYIILPVIMVGWLQAIIGFFIVTFACGLFISIVFQLAHVVEATEFPVPEATSNKMNQEWAIHQVSTTANFATHSKILFWLLGGLNFQIEHHLFPRISHVHYPEISRIVKETCKEYNIAYHEYSSMASAFFSHLLFLRKLGTS